MWIKSFILRPFEDLLNGLEAQVLGPKNPVGTLLVILVALIVSWFVYVPIHELLHAFGCLAAGGEVTELQVQAKYGGTILAGMFSWVTVGGDYAGRLTGFDCHGSDLCYFFTTFAPFLLTIVPGVPLLIGCMHRRAPLRFGLALLLGLAPLINLTGDYHELGSIVVTRVAQKTGMIDDEALARLRSDDIFRLIDELSEKPLAIGPGRTYTLVTLSALMAMFLALLTYHAGIACARACGMRRPVPARREQAAEPTPE